MIEEWHTQTKVVLGKISKGELAKLDDVAYSDDKMVTEQVKSTKDCMKAINLRYAELSAAKNKKKAK